MEYEIEGIMYSSGVFTYAAYTYDEMIFCVKHGFHEATDQEIEEGEKLERLMGRIN